MEVFNLMNKKGISPLIATVLIIGFTIVAAVLVITWINSLVGGQTDTQACKSDALTKCTDLTRFVTYGITGTNGTITNSGGIDFIVNAIFLNSDSEILTGCSADKNINVGTYSTVTTNNCSDTDLAKIKFLPTVTGIYGNTECTEVCGTGTIIEV